MFEDVIKKEKGSRVPKMIKINWEKSVKQDIDEATKELAEAVRETEDDISRDIAGGELWRLTTWLLSTDRYNNRYGNTVDQAIHTIASLEAQMDELGDYLLKNDFHADEILKGDCEGGAVELAIRLLKLYSNRVK